MASTEPSAALGLLPQTATFSGRRCRRMTSSPSSPLVDVKCPQPARAITLTSHSLEACFRVQRSLSSGQDWISSRGGAQDPRSRATSRSRAGVGASNHEAPFEHHMFAAYPAPHTLPPGSSLSRCRWRSTSLHSARLLRREKSPRAPSRCSTGVHVLAARDGIRPEGAPMGLPGSLVQAFLERSAFSAPPPATHAQNGHS